MVPVLLYYGADVNLRNAGGWLPLHLAASSNQLPMLRLLIAKGSRLDVRSEALVAWDAICKQVRLRRFLHSKTAQHLSTSACACKVTVAW